MITTPTSFTHDYLSSLKFKELQKLSAQYRVNKRWAKKQELIDNLLALRGTDKTIRETKQENEIEWRDGSTIFNDRNFDTSNEANRRLTFNIPAKASADAKTPQAPLEPKNNEEALLCGTTNSRETYSIPPSKIDFNIQPLTESRATFDIPPKSHLLEETDPRATYDVPQNGKKLLEENELDEGNSNLQNSTHSQREEKNFASSDFKEKLKKLQFDINIKDNDHTKEMKSRVKMLTIPYARVTRRTRRDGEASKNDNSPIKMSKKSINIKKSTRPAVSKSPALSSVRTSVSLTRPQSGANVGHKMPLKLQFAESPKADAVSDKSKKILRRGPPKTSDEVPEKKPNSLRVSFKTTPSSMTKNAKAAPLKRTPLLKDANRRLSSGSVQTPATCKRALPAKPITATKMPDFNKIHKRQFEQMDSLHDYVRKKEERVRKLFGASQPGQQLQVRNRSTPLFRFHSGVARKDDADKENLKSLATPLKRKDHDAKGAHKEAFKSKLPPSKLQSGIKDKNRSHIHGVRTNKRFELQMKLRNM